MKDKLPPIYFYIPQSDLSEQDIPENPDTNWQFFAKGIYNWTLQTYLRLKNYNFPCELVTTIPAEGIVLSHRDSLPDKMPFSSENLLIICLQADREPHPCAQIQIVQNPRQLVLGYQKFWNSYFMPHWQQPGLIPRDVARGDKIENIAYFGLERNLEPELKNPSWQEKLNALGLRWQIVNRNSWNDYSNVDIVLAMRSFKPHSYFEKPATKLYCAWQAGALAIVGRESAFQAEKKSELDYIEVTSVDELIAALKRLQDDRELYRTMIENGRIRAQETNVKNLVKRWQDFLINIAVPAYDRWCNSSKWSRQSIFLRQLMSLKVIRMQNRVDNLLSQISGNRNDG